MITLYSWNINGIRAAQRKGFLNWLQATSPDILCLQETKAHPDQLDSALRCPDGYYSYFASAEKRGYSGVAIYSKQEPISVQVGIGVPQYDSEGRTLIAEYTDFTVISVYVPSGSRDSSRVEYKLAFLASFIECCNNLCERGKPLIFCGDINIAHQELDLARPKENMRSSGFLPEERAWIDRFIESGYIDIFRTLYPDRAGAYTWWSQVVATARPNNSGWRLDTFFITTNLQDRVIDAAIHPEIFGSDHCPVSLTLNL